MNDYIETVTSVLARLVEAVAAAGFVSALVLVPAIEAALPLVFSLFSVDKSFSNFASFF